MQVIHRLSKMISRGYALSKATCSKKKGDEAVESRDIRQTYNFPHWILQKISVSHWFRNRVGGLDVVLSPVRRAGSFAVLALSTTSCVATIAISESPLAKCALAAISIIPPQSSRGHSPHRTADTSCSGRPDTLLSDHTRSFARIGWFVRAFASEWIVTNTCRNTPAKWLNNCLIDNLSILMISNRAHRVWWSNFGQVWRA